MSPKYRPPSLWKYRMSWRRHSMITLSTLISLCGRNNECCGSLVIFSLLLVRLSAIWDVMQFMWHHCNMLRFAQSSWPVVSDPSQNSNSFIKKLSYRQKLLLTASSLCNYYVTIWNNGCYIHIQQMLPNVTKRKNIYRFIYRNILTGCYEIGHLFFRFDSYLVAFQCNIYMAIIHLWIFSFKLLYACLINQCNRVSFVYTCLKIDW